MYISTRLSSLSLSLSVEMQAATDNNMSDLQQPSSDPRPPLSRDPSSQQKPRGILKNVTSPNPADDGGLGAGAGAGVAPGGEAGVKWDEVNLNLNEVNRDSTMKITEPKVGAHRAALIGKGKRSS